MAADDDLITRAKQGDQDAWASLYRQHAGRLLAWLSLRPTGDSSTTADDVAAETWYLAAAKIAKFNGTSDEFAGWLFGTARKLHSNARRTSARRATSPAPSEQLIEVAGPSDDLGEHLTWVTSVLSMLSARERDVIGLVDVIGMDPAVAAEALNITHVALRVARHRGLRKLQFAGRSVPKGMWHGMPGVV